MTKKKKLRNETYSSSEHFYFLDYHQQGKRSILHLRRGKQLDVDSYVWTTTSRIFEFGVCWIPTEFFKEMVVSYMKDYELYHSVFCELTLHFYELQLYKYVK